MGGGSMKVDVAELAGIMAEGPLFGICCVLDISAIYILVRRKRYARLNKPLLAAAIVMLALVIAQFVVDAANIFMGFISIADKPRSARILFFQDLTQPIFAAKHAIFFTMMIVGDTIVIYRCYVVWNRKLWVVLLPILCSLGSGACAYYIIWRIRNNPHFESIFFSLVRDMGLAIFSLSFGANAIATSLLAYKIWQADRVLKKSMLSSTNRITRVPIIRIVIESGIVNTAYLLVYTVMLRIGSSGIEVMASIVTPLLGIIFSTVIIRAAMASETQARTAISTGRPGSSNEEAYYPRPDRIIIDSNAYSMEDTVTMDIHLQTSRSDLKHSDSNSYRATAL